MEISENYVTNLHFNKKLEILAFVSKKSILKIKKFVTKSFRKEKRKEEFEFILRDINTENLFCSISSILFQNVKQINNQDYLLVSDNKRLIFLYDYSSRYTKFFLRGRLVTDTLIRSVSWLTPTKFIVTDIKGTSNVYSPNFDFTKDINYHQIKRFGSFSDKNCIDFFNIDFEFCSDAYAGINKYKLINSETFKFFELLNDFILKEKEILLTINEKSNSMHQHKNSLNNFIVYYPSLFSLNEEVFIEVFKKCFSYYKFQKENNKNLIETENEIEKKVNYLNISLIIKSFINLKDLSKLLNFFNESSNNSQVFKILQILESFRTIV